jgi:hypothetical protein
MPEPKYVALVRRQELYEIVLLDDDHNPIGHGYRGPTQKRADQDLKYWTRTKGLKQVERPDESQ